METPSSSKSSLGSGSPSKVALEFLRRDSARFKTTPLRADSKDMMELQRKKERDKHYKALIHDRKRKQRESELKLNTMDSLNDIQSGPNARWRSGSVGSSTPGSAAATNLLPWPGFRYHNNGDVRNLSKIEKERRMLDTMRMMLSHTMSTLETPRLTSGCNEDATSPSKLSKGSSINTVNAYVDACDQRASSCSLDAESTISKTSEVSDLASVAASLRRASASAAVTKKRTYRTHAKISMNPIRSLVRPVTTSSMWCNGGEELREREAHIPKDSFNIKFGVPSKMMHMRNKDLDEYRLKEERRSIETTEGIKQYIANIQGHPQLRGM